MRDMRLKLFLTLIVFLAAPLTAQAELIDFPQVKIQALNKSTARTQNFTIKVGETIEYGSLFIKLQACRKAEPLDKPEDAAFLQVWEVPIGKDKSEWIFSGWMFSSSPAVSAMDHAIYDVWVLECFDPDAKPVEPVNKIIINDEEFIDKPEEENPQEGEVDETVSEPVTEEVIEEVVEDVPAEEVINGATQDAIIEEEITSPIIIEEDTSNQTIEYEAPAPSDYNSQIIQAEPFDTMIDDVITDETLTYE